MVHYVFPMIPQHSYITVGLNANVDQVTKENIVNNQSDLATAIGLEMKVSETKNGVYHIIDSNGNSFPVRCYFGAYWSWTVIQTFKDRSNLDENTTQPVNENDPKAVPYRLSYFRILPIRQNSSKWRINHGFRGTGCWDVTHVGIDTDQNNCTSCVTRKYINSTDNHVKNECYYYPCQDPDSGGIIDNYGLFCCYNSTSNECSSITRTRTFLGQRYP